jgi:hypothetical protein
MWPNWFRGWRLPGPSSSTLLCRVTGVGAPSNHLWCTRFVRCCRPGCRACYRSKGIQSQVARRRANQSSKRTASPPLNSSVRSLLAVPFASLVFVGQRVDVRCFASASGLEFAASRQVSERGGFGSLFLHGVAQLVMACSGRKVLTSHSSGRLRRRLIPALGRKKGV